MKALCLTIAFVALMGSAPTDGVGQTSVAGDWTFYIRTDSDHGGALRLRINIAQDDRLLVARGVAGIAGPFEMTGSTAESAVQLVWEPNFRFKETPFGLSLTGTVEEGYMSGSAVWDIEGVHPGYWYATRN